MKPEEVNAMTDEQLRIKAAELVGWRKLDGYKDEWKSGPDDSDTLGPPDYPNDIAAAISLEPKDKRREYGKALIDVLGFTFCDMLTWEIATDFAFASARDRTIAFILAMDK